MEKSNVSINEKYARIIKECTTNNTPRFTTQPRTTVTTAELKIFLILSSNEIIHHLYKEDKFIVKMKTQQAS